MRCRKDLGKGSGPLVPSKFHGLPKALLKDFQNVAEVLSECLFIILRGGEVGVSEGIVDVDLELGLYKVLKEHQLEDLCVESRRR